MEKIHPAIHVNKDKGGVAVGVVRDTGYACVVAPNTVIDKSAASAFVRSPYVFKGVREKWYVDHFDPYIKNPQAPSWAEAYEQVFRLVDEYAVLKNDREHHIVATWSMATYLHQLWTAFPRLNFNGNTHTGKSKVLRVISLLAFNGRHYLKPSAAVLYRLIDGLRPTLCLDEIERLDKPGVDEINDILNAGYQKDTPVPKNVKNKDEGWDPTDFEVYCPIAFAGIKGLHEVLEDRCITILTMRSTDRESINRPMPEDSAAFQAARAGCYAVFLLRFKDVVDARPELPDWLNGRRRELYLPLLTIAHLCSEESFKAIESYAHEDVESHSEVSEDTAALIKALYLILNKPQVDQIRVFPHAVAAVMEPDTFGRPLAPRLIGTALRREGVHSAEKGSRWCAIRRHAGAGRRACEWVWDHARRECVGNVPRM
jgi:hypothetical protein